MNSFDVFWISSFPKSGNTWLHNVIRQAALSKGFPSSDLDVYNLVKNNKSPSVCHALNENLFPNNGFVMKTHSAYDAVHSEVCGIKLLTKGFIHIYRNPLDLLLSYINYTRIEYEQYKNDEDYKNYLFLLLLGFEKKYTYEEWLGMRLEDIPTRNLDNALLFFSKNNLSLPFLYNLASGWYENIISWKNKVDNNTGFMIKYEDMFGEFAEIELICNVFKITPNEFYTSRLEFNNAISSSKKGSLDASIFYNKMKKSYFFDFYSKRAIDEFQKKHEIELRSLNYSY